MEFERIADKKRTDFIVAAVQRFAAPGGEVLDIGCGNGIISRTLGQCGFRVTGIDVSEKTIATAKAANTLPNVEFRIVGDGELTVEKNRYQAIICSEVLEHLYIPAHLLHIIRESLCSAGVLIVTVPNGQGPRELFVTRPVQSLQRRSGNAWKLMNAIKRLMGFTGITVQTSAEDLRHIHFFSRRTLTELASATGFVITEWCATNFLEQVFPFSLLTRRSQWLQQLDCRLANRMPIGFTSGFMTVWKKTVYLQNVAE